MPDAAVARPAATPLDLLLGARGVLVLAPHPDDETLGCGALLAACFAAGRPAHVLVLTDGDKSHRASAHWPPDRLARQRRHEALQAVRRLGGRDADVSFLGFPDCGVPDAGPALVIAAQRVKAVLDRHGLGVLIATAETDPHCDHQATARIALTVRRMSPGLNLLFYPIWSRNAGLGPSGPGGFTEHRLSPGVHAAAKRAALQAHASQLGALITDDPGGFTLPPALVEFLLTEDEIFLEPNDAIRHG